MRTICFDQSTRFTGYALFDGIDLVRWGRIDLGKEKDADKRVENMIRQVCGMIEASNPDMVVFENTQMQKSVQALIKLVRVQGAILGYCVLHNLNYTIYLPTQWRKIIGLKQGMGHDRNDVKWQAIYLIKKSYGIEVDDDCAEGILLGLAYFKEHDLLPEFDKLKRSRKNIGEKPIS